MGSCQNSGSPSSDLFLELAQAESHVVGNARYLEAHGT